MYLPHACGGEPYGVQLTTEALRHLPHACGGEPGFTEQLLAADNHLPHACGGEPSNEQIARALGRICPTHVGVNR